jgi:hypothetical protein
VEFLTEREFSRRFRAATKARAAELQGLGISADHARAQARKEFSVYDCIEMDEQGRIRIDGLELPPIPDETSDL